MRPGIESLFFHSQCERRMTARINERRCLYNHFDIQSRVREAASLICQFHYPNVQNLFLTFGLIFCVVFLLLHQHFTRLTVSLYAIYLHCTGTIISEYNESNINMCVCAKEQHLRERKRNQK